MNTFTLNGNTIVAKKFSFNLLCDLDRFGVSIDDAGKHPLPFVRAYIALCMDADEETAGQELEAHLSNGNDLGDILDVMNKELEASDFFRAMSKQTGTPTETPKRTTKTTKAR